MAEYTTVWDAELASLARDFYEKKVGDCTAGELRALMEIMSARKRLAKVDAFIASLK